MENKVNRFGPVGGLLQIGMRGTLHMKEEV